MESMNISQVQDKFNNGEDLDFIFFWDKGMYINGEMNKGCCTQWHRGRPFTVGCIEYQTAEHWMMSEKARLFGDYDSTQNIFNSDHPRDALALGRSVKNYDQVKWNTHKFDIVLRGNYHKFSQYDELKNWLLSTGDSIIVEASPHDKIWGVGLMESDPAIMNPNLWEGENLLGFAIMKVREMFRNNESL